MKKPFVNSSEQLKERLRRIVKKPNFLLTAEITFLITLVLLVGFLLVSVLQSTGSEAQAQPTERVQLVGIEITTMPTRCVYVRGQSPDTAGMELQLTYSDGTTEKVTKGFACSPQVFEDYGKQTISVILDDKTDTFEVMVKEAVIQGSCGENLLWAVTPDGELIISGSGKMRDFEENRAPWKNLKTTIQTVYLPEGLRNIGNNAFAGCIGLAELQFPEGLLNIGDYAFSGCAGLTELRIPETVRSIGNNAFEGCLKLQSFRIPEKVKKLGERAFFNCTALREVILPEGMTHIGRGAFRQCESLKGITLPDSLTTIGEDAFRESGLQQITIPGGVTRISAGMFSGCSDLKSLVLPKTISAIDDYAFESCYSLESFEIPPKVSNIDSRAFNYSGVKNFTVDPQNPYLEADEYGVLYTKGLKKLVLYPCKRVGSYAIAQGCEEIEGRAFYDSRELSGITFPDTLKRIGGGAFWFCGKLTQVTVPASVQHLGNVSFYSCMNLKALCVMNPQCEIPFDILGSPKKTVFYGYEGSTLDQYAFELDCRFVVLEE